MSLEKEKVIAELKHILVEELFIDIPQHELKDDDKLSNGIGLDSVGVIELIAIVEDKYAISVERREESRGAGLELGGVRRLHRGAGQGGRGLSAARREPAVSHRRRVAVTGLGCISALGRSVPQVWRALTEGSSGIAEIASFGKAGFRNRHAGEVVLEADDVALADHEGGESRWSFFARAAAREALVDRRRRGAGGESSGPWERGKRGRPRRRGCRWVCRSKRGALFARDDSPVPPAETMHDFGGLLDGLADEELGINGEAAKR